MGILSFKRAFRGERLAWLLSVLVAMTAGVIVGNRWAPEIERTAGAAMAALAGKPQAEAALHAGHDEGDEDHDEHDEHGEEAHAHGADAHTYGKPVYDHVHDEAGALKLSQEAKGNIGLRTARVELRAFERTITVPGMIVERPGWSTLEVTAPMTGVVTRIHPIQGETVRPGQPLFEVRLTHEDLLQLQTEFLRTVEEFDVVGREVSRLEKVAAEGAVAGKSLLERKYEQQKLEAGLRAQRQALVLHGLTQEQVENISSTRKLLQSLTVYAPRRERSSSTGAAVLQVQDLKASEGAHVTAGAVLCRLADHAELYIEGKAFEQDARPISLAVSRGWRVSAVLGSKDAGGQETIGELKILYLEDKVDLESRVLHFYVSLPNRVACEDRSPDGRCFVYWQYKPGQRTQIHVPVEKWADRIVMPIEAVAQDGAEYYVFEANGDHFDRRAVHVEYRDQDYVVIANDGALRLGSTVAGSAAQQIQLALKSRAGGGVDPHAGHNH